MNLKLTLACGPYDRIDALAQTSIAIEGIDLQVETIQSPRELFDRVEKGEFQLTELSASEFVSCFRAGVAARGVVSILHPGAMACKRGSTTSRQWSVKRLM